MQRAWRLGHKEAWVYCKLLYAEMPNKGVFSFLFEGIPLQKHLGLDCISEQDMWGQ